MAVSLGAVPQAIDVVPYEVVGLRRGLDPKQHMRQVQRGEVGVRLGVGVGVGAGVHLREQSSVEPILAVDPVPYPTLASEDLVDLPTGLLERTPGHHYSPHHPTHSRHLGMLHRLARICHILHNYLDPREWALCQWTRETGGQAGKEEY